MPHNAIFYDDGRLQLACPLSPQQALLQYASGVYTTALITPDGMLIDWELHRRRLLRGVEVLNTRPDRPFQTLLSALQVQGATPADFLNSHVVPAVRAALAAFYNPRQPTSRDGQEAVKPAHGPPGAVPAREPCASEAPPTVHHAMLVVCIAPGPEADGDGDREVGAAAAPAPATAASAVAGAHARVQADTPGREQSYGDQGSGGGAARGCGAGDGGQLPVAIGVYVKAVQPPPYGAEHAVQAAVMGRPRSLAGAKACSWVAERRTYEERKPAEAAEVLLSDAGGRILEGLTTNFAVITVDTDQPPTTTPLGDGGGSRDGDAAPGDTQSAAGAAGAATGAVTLHTCGPAGGAVLPGVVAGRLMEAAAALGMRVALEAPASSERGRWREAFISNCIKRVQPLRRVFCPPGNAWGADPWDCELPSPAGPHTTALLRELEARQQRTHWGEL